MRTKPQLAVVLATNDGCAAPKSKNVEHSILELQSPEIKQSSSQQDSESNRKLLHRRRLFATTTMACILITLKIIGVVFAGTVAGFAIAVDFVWVLALQTDAIVATGETERLAESFMTLSFALAILIGTYGMFIPGQWRRTAVVTSLFALLPATTAIVLRQRRNATSV